MWKIMRALYSWMRLISDSFPFERDPCEFPCLFLLCEDSIHPFCHVEAHQEGTILLLFFFLGTNNSTREFHCENFIDVCTILWTSWPPPLYSIQLPFYPCFLKCLVGFIILLSYVYMQCEVLHLPVPTFIPLPTDSTTTFVVPLLIHVPFSLLLSLSF
jgi:hypothetical protein